VSSVVSPTTEDNSLGAPFLTLKRTYLIGRLYSLSMIKRCASDQDRWRFYLGFFRMSALTTVHINHHIGIEGNMVYSMRVKVGDFDSKN
jgi:hypothetical protein